MRQADTPAAPLRGVLVLAKQRCGTNFLRSLLAETGGMRDFGEVFQPRKPDGLSRYDRWLAQAPDQPGTTYADSVTRSDAFLAALETEGFPCIDVKYNSVLRSIGTWYSPADLPPILAAALRRDYLVIHLQRVNRLEHAVSSWIAGRTGRYVDRGNNAHDAPEQFEIPLHAVRRIARTYDLEAAQAEAWLARVPLRTRPEQVMPLTYEALSGAQPEALADQVGAILGRCGIAMTGSPAARTRKLLPDWRRQVSNAATLEEAFATGD